MSNMCRPIQSGRCMSAAKLQGAERAVVVADYIAGMTDRYALGEVKRVSRTTSCPVSNQLF